MPVISLLSIWYNFFVKWSLIPYAQYLQKISANLQQGTYGK
jgi:hypothetical protein